MEKSAQASANVDPTIAASIAAASPAAVAQTLSTSYPYIIYGSDYGMQCNGIADDTTALNNTMTAAQSNSGLANAQASGVQVILPGGLCLISGAINVAVTKSMAVSGLGIGATHLQWTAPTNGFSFVVSNSASLSFSDMTISKRVGTNPSGSTFVGQALSIAAGGPDVTQYDTYLPRHTNVGAITVANLSIYPGVPNGQTDSWAVGIDMIDLQGPTISNVAVGMPGWGLLPNPHNNATPISALPSPTTPGPPNNGSATPTSGTTAAGSSAANLGIGVADGILLQGTDATSSDPNAADYSVDAVVTDLSTSGGLVGLDLYRFQGAYISTFKSVSNAIGLRADTPSNVTELLSLSGSQLSDTVEGVYLNGVAGTSINGNYFLHADGALKGLPTWSGIWIRDGTNNSVSGNNINGDGTGSVSAEYGIYLSDDANDGTGGFPDTVSGNELASISGICLGNDKYVTAISGTGNSMRACGTYILDSAANIPYYTDDNSYFDNISNSPDVSETSNGVTVPEPLTVGSFATLGSIKVLSDNLQTFMLDQNGNLTVAGGITLGGELVAAGDLVTGGSIVAANIATFGNLQHTLYEEAVGGFANGGGIITLTTPGGGFPYLTSGAAAVNGELYCSAGGFLMSWRLNGHWAVKGGTLASKAFQAIPETDADTTFALSTLTGSSSVTPQPIADPPGIQVAVGSGFTQTIDCTADLQMIVAN